MAAAQEQEQFCVEGESFAWGSLPALLVGGYGIVLTVERAVCATLWANCHLDQQQILQCGVFLNTKALGAMTCALRSRSREAE